MKIQPNKDVVRELEKEVQEIERKIPSEYNRLCVWYDKAEDDSLEEVLYVHTSNMNKAIECYVRHNSLIELLRQRGAF